MLIYYFLMLIPCAFYGIKIAAKVDKKTVDRQTVVLFFLILLLMLCVRDITIGIDTEVYIYLFDEVSSKSWSDVFTLEYEWGWFLFQKLLQLITTNPRILLVVCAFVNVIPVMYCSAKESKNALVTIALFLTVAPFTMYFSGIRQCFAMSIGVWSYYCVKNKKPIRFLISVLLAFTFHQSAFFLVIMYPLYIIKFKRHHWYIMLLILLVVLVLRTPIFSLMATLLPEKYQGGYAEIKNTGATGMLLVLLVLTVYSFLFVDEKQMDRDDFGLRTLLFFTLVMQMFAPVNALAMRFNYYLLIFVPITITKMSAKSYKSVEGINSLIMFVMVAFLMAYFLINGYIGSDPLNIFPFISEVKLL